MFRLASEVSVYSMDINGSGGLDFGVCKAKLLWGVRLGFRLMWFRIYGEGLG
jgi:hypothetical protein